jgi:hypothetical protein
MRQKEWTASFFNVELVNPGKLKGMRKLPGFDGVYSNESMNVSIFLWKFAKTIIYDGDLNFH